jgi:Putative adhesin
MKISIHIKYCLFLAFILRGGISFAQTTLQVVTKTVEKTLTYKSGFSLNIDAEKAEITLKANPNAKEISVKMELISKNPNLQDAKKDIDAIKYVAENQGKIVYLRNYIGIEKGAAKPTSDLKTRYTIEVPSEMAVSIKNNFGKLNVSGLRSKMMLITEFCKTTLTDIKGEMSINTRLGDIDGRGLEGKISVQSNRSDLFLSMTKGECAIMAQYGKVNIETDKTFTQLSIKADKAEVHFLPPPATAINYDLEAEYGKVILPQKLTPKYIEKTDKKEKVNFNYFDVGSDKKKTTMGVFIQTSFSSIEIRN